MHAWMHALYVTEVRFFMRRLVLLLFILALCMSIVAGVRFLPEDRVANLTRETFSR